MKNIVVAIDQDGTSDAAIRMARSLARKFIGATCESVVRHSECPVLVLPSE